METNTPQNPTGAPVPLNVHPTMPTLNGEAVPSLSTCSTNLHASCDFHTAQRYLHYLSEWRHPAPKKCHRRNFKPKEYPPPTTDRLGINVERMCDLR